VWTNSFIAALSAIAIETKQGYRIWKSVLHNPIVNTGRARPLFHAGVHGATMLHTVVKDVVYRKEHFVFFSAARTLIAVVVIHHLLIVGAMLPPLMPSYQLARSACSGLWL
jgi:succinate dehydrogenase hydrophobic anchor subunit